VEAIAWMPVHLAFVIIHLLHVIWLFGDLYLIVGIMQSYLIL